MSNYPIFYKVPAKPNWQDIPEMLKPVLPLNKDFIQTGCIRISNGKIEMATSFVEEILITKKWPPVLFSDGWTNHVWVPLPVGSTIWMKNAEADVDVILPTEGNE